MIRWESYIIGNLAHQTSRHLKKDALKVGLRARQGSVIENTLGISEDGWQRLVDKQLQIRVGEESKACFSLDLPQRPVGVDDPVS